MTGKSFLQGKPIGHSETVKNPTRVRVVNCIGLNAYAYQFGDSIEVGMGGYLGSVNITSKNAGYAESWLTKAVWPVVDNVSLF